MKMANNPLRRLPSVNELLESPQLKSLVEKLSHNVVVSEVRTFLEGVRDELKHKTADMKIPSAGEMAERIANWIVSDQRPRLQPVVNATGVLLHTGLGRAPLAEQALRDVHDVAAGYASVEINLETGERSQRVETVSKLILELVGGEAALVVNNNAGATLLTLAALAHGKEVVVSRGHLVEIGGSYRLPDVMSASGAVLREVGTTNKTRLIDFQSAIHDNTGALMRVHTSNYIIAGFTEQPALAELVRLGHSRELPVIDDIGSGALIDFSKYGLAGEPMAKESLSAGADLVLFSGDKLLGGPQCGIIVGKRTLIQKITNHPLTRALRVDKMTLAALGATLRLYRDPAQAESSIPLLQLLSTAQDNLKNRAERLAPQIAHFSCVEAAEAVEDVSYLGGGSVPTQQLRTWCVAVRPRGMSVDELARRLRTGPISVIGRIKQDRLLLDLRSVFASQDSLLADAFGRFSVDSSAPKES
jgi:L-seryl-tRNA(Ser) seleniumtransferase